MRVDASLTITDDTVTVTLTVVAWPVMSVIVTVQVPAATGVTVNTALGPLAALGAIVAMTPDSGAHVSVSIKAPL